MLPGRACGVRVPASGGRHQTEEAHFRRAARARDEVGKHDRRPRQDRGGAV